MTRKSLRVLRATGVVVILVAVVAYAIVRGCSSSHSASTGALPDDLPDRLHLWKTVDVHDRPFAMQSSDVNGDGRPDVLVGGSALTVLLTDGAGGVEACPPMAGIVDATDFAIGDFDEDGQLDIAVADHDAPQAQFLVFRGSENQCFEPAPGSPFIVDAIPHLHTLATADFDGDHHLDLVTDSWPENRLVLVRGRGDGTFKTPGESFGVPATPIQNLRAADMNQDGFVDLVVPAHEAAAVSVLLSNGHGTFRAAPGSPYRSFGGFSTVALADMNNDGAIDVVEVHRSDRSTQYREDALSILINAGDGTLAHAPGSPYRSLPNRSNDVAVGDMNGDGWLDVAVLGESHGVVALLRGGETGLMLDSRTDLPGRPLGLTIADADGDGRSELFVSDNSGDRVLILKLESDTDASGPARTTN